ncbi:MAG TPA: hypothetical protein VMW47_10350 [Verrucomicrobiae bacterium]|nr:hypothetical protein [Verrucomicrobiae bacterium]
MTIAGVARWLEADARDVVKVVPRARPGAITEAGLRDALACWCSRVGRRRLVPLVRRQLLLAAAIGVGLRLVAAAAGAAPARVGILVPGVIAVAGVLWGIHRRPAVAATARLIDHDLGLAARSATALEIQRLSRSPGGLSDRVVVEASAVVTESLGFARAVARRAPLEWVLLALALTVLAALTAIAGPPPARGRGSASSSTGAAVLGPTGAAGPGSRPPRLGPRRGGAGALRAVVPPEAPRLGRAPTAGIPLRSVGSRSPSTLAAGEPVGGLPAAPAAGPAIVAARAGPPVRPGPGDARAPGPGSGRAGAAGPAPTIGGAGTRAGRTAAGGGSARPRPPAGRPGRGVSPRPAPPAADAGARRRAPAAGSRSGAGGRPGSGGAARRTPPTPRSGTRTAHQIRGAGIGGRPIAGTRGDEATGTRGGGTRGGQARAASGASPGRPAGLGPAARRVLLASGAAPVERATGADAVSAGRAPSPGLGPARWLALEGGGGGGRSTLAYVPPTTNDLAAPEQRLLLGYFQPVGWLLAAPW